MNLNNQYSTNKKSITDYAKHYICFPSLPINCVICFDKDVSKNQKGNGPKKQKIKEKMKTSKLITNNRPIQFRTPSHQNAYKF